MKYKARSIIINVGLGEQTHPKIYCQAKTKKGTTSQNHFNPNPWG